MSKHDNEPKVAMLLDPDHFYGEHEGRLAPTLIFLCVSLAPALVYGYYTLYFIIPFWLFLPVWLFYVLRCGLVILGDEKTRLKNFLKQLNDVFSAIYDMLRIKTIHSDGCVEYLNGSVCYIIVGYNGTTDDVVKRSILLKKFQSQLVGDHSYDIAVQNITDMPALENRYNNVKLFVDMDAAKDFIDIIDYNRSIVQKSSLLTRTVYIVKGRRSEWKELKESIEAALKSSASKAFKSVYLVEDKDEIESLLSKDIDGLIKLEEMLRKKYCTKQYYDSYVSGYDNEETKVEIKSEELEEGFHTKYSEK